MRKYKYLLVDLDGVIWRGEKPIKKNVEALIDIAEKEVEIYYITNNSTKSRVEYVDRLKRFGISTDTEHIVNAAYLAAHYVLGAGGEKVFIIGEAGMYYEASIAGLVPVTIGSSAEYVIVGLDRFLTYSKVAYATKLIRMGARFIATNADNVYPVEEGFDPGAGSIISMIREVVGRDPDIVIGKPNPWILDFLAERHGVELDRALVVGDRIDTDVMMGAARGVDTLFLLTGVGEINDIERYGLKPTYVARDLAEFYRECRECFEDS